MQVRAAEAELRHKLFPPNAWMKVLHFNVLTSCPKDELHQWFIGLYGEHIIPAIVHRYTQVLQRPDLFTLDRNGEKEWVFFSAFEDLLLHTSGTMETNGIRKLYEPSPVPTLYVGRMEDLLGRVPFRASLMTSLPLPFRTSTRYDRSRPCVTQEPCL